MLFNFVPVLWFLTETLLYQQFPRSNHHLYGFRFTINIATFRLSSVMFLCLVGRFGKSEKFYISATLTSCHSHVLLVI